MLDNLLFKIKKYIPRNLFSWVAPLYHYKMALLGAIWYRFPSRKLVVVAVTGTKGKSSVTEILNSILEEAGHQTALTNTIRFKVGDTSEDNLYKMSMPGRFFMQRFLRRAVSAGCKYAVIEMTSQGAEMYRHRFIDIDALIVTNLAPEHIEAHGSYEKYIEAKLKIAQAVARSPKRRNMIIVNKEDRESPRFLAVDPVEKYEYSIEQARPFEVSKQGISFTYENTNIHSPLSGKFNIYNCLAAITFAKTQGVSVDVIKNALDKFSGIRGRVEHIEGGQDFTVIVDYAHTPDSLQKLYDVFQDTRRICVLGNTGGGRDKWKRDEMAHIAERSCDEVILTNEDPYDDDPMEIITDMAEVMKEKKPIIIVDRREAIAHALSLARTGDSVLITGKGTDPYIMGPDNTKIPWSDALVAREELSKILKKN
jgi:UDP-N-acetylmuramoyl-L-alanyl-D-glutamate--2,6-diaminopimelate ligase